MLLVNHVPVLQVIVNHVLVLRHLFVLIVSLILATDCTESYCSCELYIVVTLFALIQIRLCLRITFKKSFFDEKTYQIKLLISILKFFIRYNIWTNQSWSLCSSMRCEMSLRTRITSLAKQCTLN